MIILREPHRRGKLPVWHGWLYNGGTDWPKLVDAGWLRARLPVEPCKALPLSQVPERIKN